MSKSLYIRKSKLLFITFIILSVSIMAKTGAASKAHKPEEIKSVKHVEWSRTATIYEVNIRQYTRKGTFKAFAKSLPRLKKMGVDILWFMPIHPIGELNRKGTLGSYYSVKDYTAVDPAYGTVNDFKNVVKQAHKLGMHVIIDWVANHTAWDNVWVKSHPDFYTKDKKGNFVPPVKDWTDVIDLNYDNKELWNYMRDAMKFWIDKCNIDGFRCDVAAMVPTEFWVWVRPQLEKSKPIFMLAEASEPELHQVFDMTYNWQLKDLFVGCAEGKKNPSDFYKYFEKEKKEYPVDSYRMVFTSNHDENSWNGTDKERYGNAAEAFAVVTGVVPGMPLVYNGQEAGLNKRLSFFEKDTINWKPNKMSGIYSKLFHLKKENNALWNGTSGGEFQKVPVNNKSIFSFYREKGKDKVVAFFNFSKEKQEVNLKNAGLQGTFRNLFTNQTVILTTESKITITPWGYEILTK